MTRDIRLWLTVIDHPVYQVITNVRRNLRRLSHSLRRYGKALSR